MGKEKSAWAQSKQVNTSAQEVNDVEWNISEYTYSTLQTNEWKQQDSHMWKQEQLRISLGKQKLKASLTANVKTQVVKNNNTSTRKPAVRNKGYRNRQLGQSI